MFRRIAMIDHNHENSRIVFEIGFSPLFGNFPGDIDRFYILNTLNPLGQVIPQTSGVHVDLERSIKIQEYVRSRDIIF
ncbi:hypothetical protein CRX59_11870 [Burkholderia thailandensis]|nr:hypothetical protein CRX59_11870 [Burkholderia thailandensis]PNE80492.1 hypothetical protein A8H34_21145 [Burkholderia thailandensis]PNE86436.1 hypothetical protein A8H30_20800 [Burkholderia thailandensis]